MFLSNRASKFGVLFVVVTVLVGFTPIVIVISMLKVVNILSIETIGDKTRKVSKGQRMKNMKPRTGGLRRPPQNLHRQN